MRRITLKAGKKSINTTCENLSQNIWNRLNIHGLSKRGKAWFDKLTEEDGRVWVIAGDKEFLLDELTDGLF